MKKTESRIKICLGVVLALAVAASSCTGDFEYFNTDPNAAQEVDQASLITTMQLDAA